MITLNMDYEEIVKGLKRQAKHYEKYRSTVPEGKQGPWSIEKFKIDIDLTNLRMVRDGRGCSPGTFTRLTHEKRGVIMSDTDAEINDFLHFINAAKGTILIAGLGLGLVTEIVAKSDNVESVTVVEIDQDVIDLVAKHMPSNVQVIKADIREWKPPKGLVFNLGWYDIWDNICGDNWPEMCQLKRRFSRQVKTQFAWCEREVRRLK